MTVPVIVSGMKGTHALTLAALVWMGCSRPDGKAGSGASTSAAASPAASALATEVAAQAAEAGAARSTLPPWVAFAERAPLLGEQAKKERHNPRVKQATLSSIDGLFESVTKEPETGAGLYEAARIIEEGKPLGSDREWSGSGTSPGAVLLHHGGMALLVDLGQRACAARPGDDRVGTAADTAPLPPMFNSGGPDKGVAERDRHLLQEATRACGSHP